MKSVALVLNSKTAMLHDLTVIRADNCMTILKVIELSSYQILGSKCSCYNIEIVLLSFKGKIDI